jgi:hypothetical protein
LYTNTSNSGKKIIMIETQMNDITIDGAKALLASTQQLRTRIGQV